MGHLGEPPIGTPFGCHDSPSSLCQEGVSRFRLLISELSPKHCSACLPSTPCLLSQRAGCAHPLALPASSSHTFIVVSPVTSLAPLSKGSSLGTSDIILTHLPQTAQPQKDLDHSPATHKGESFKMATKHAGGGRGPKDDDRDLTALLVSPHCQLPRSPCSLLPSRGRRTHLPGCGKQKQKQC